MCCPLLSITTQGKRDLHTRISSLSANEKETNIVLSKLNPYYISGLTDAVGYFSVICVKDKRMVVGWRLITYFQIHWPKKDRELLERVQEALGGVGKIYESGGNSCLFSVRSPLDIANTIIPHFEKYPLKTQKREDLELFKQVVQMMINKEHLSLEGFFKVLSLKVSMREGLTGVLAEAFPNVLPAASKPVLRESLIIEPYWLQGFIEGVGLFTIETKNFVTTTQGSLVTLNFQLPLNESNKELLTLIILYLNCGTLKTDGTSKIVTVTRFEDILNNIIPFLYKYPLQGVKNLQLAYFIQVAELINKTPLTREGWDNIARIKAEMDNKGIKTKSNLDEPCLLPFKPAAVYADPLVSKQSIVFDNKNKAGVYRWINKENGNAYVGSSVNLARRLADYFIKYKIKEGERRGNMIIYQALLKHGPSGFVLEILEYCEPKDVIVREQYYLTLLKPTYNSLKIAYSSLGFKHSEEAVVKMRAAHIGRKLSEELKEKLRKNLAVQNAKKAFLVEVTNIETNEHFTYPSIRDTGKAFDTNHNTIRNYIKSQKLYREVYLFSLKPLLS